MRIMNLFDLPLTSTERFLLNAVNDLEHRISNRIRGSETYIPNIDLSEDKENFYLIAELPGMTDSDVKVSVSDDVLTISGHKERKDEKKERNYHRIERSFGEFVRSISLPTNANAKDVICSFKDGLPSARPSWWPSPTRGIRTASSCLPTRGR